MKRIDVQVSDVVHEQLRQLAFKHETSIRRLATEVLMALASGEVEVASAVVIVERQGLRFGVQAEPPEARRRRTA